MNVKALVLILAIVLPLVGFYALFKTNSSLRDQVDQERNEAGRTATATTFKISDLEIQIKSTETLLVDAENSNAYDANGAREIYRRRLYGDFYESIFPQCKTWSIANWQEYAKVWDDRKESAKGKEWAIDNGRYLFKQGRYPHNEGLYLSLARSHSQLEKINKRASQKP